MKRVYTLLGITSATLGVVGIFVPVWPTTPFILLAVWLFSRTDKRFDEYLMKAKFIGPPLRNYIENRQMTVSFKIKTLTFLWAGLGLSMYFQDNLYVVLILVLIGIAVTIHILLLRIDQNDSNEEQ